MTVSSQTNNATFVGNGVTTVFPLPFRFFSNGDVFAYFIDPTTGASTPMVLGTDYTLAGAGEPEVDGNAVSVLTTTAPLANGRGLYVERIMQEVQNTDIVNQGEFFASTHEDVFDRLTMLIQQANANSQGAIRVAIGEPEPQRLPSVINRAGKVMAFDAYGDPIVISTAPGLDIDFVSVKDFGATGLGIADDTQAFIDALAASDSVYVPPGKYLVSGNITVANKKLWAMSGKSTAVPYGDDGATIITTQTANSVFLLGSGGCIDGLQFFYPNQDGSTITSVASYPTITGAPIVYPPTIKGLTTGITGFELRNLTFINAYNCIELGDPAYVTGTGRGTISNIDAFPINRFLTIYNALAEIVVSDFVLSPIVYQGVASVGDQKLRKWSQQNATHFTLSKADGLMVSRGTTLGARVNVRVNNQILSFARFENVLFDQALTALAAAHVLSNVTFKNCQFYGGTIYGDLEPAADLFNFTSATSAAGLGTLIFEGCQIQTARRFVMNLTTSNCVPNMLVTNCTFSNWASASSIATTVGAIAIGASAANIRMTVSDCLFINNNLTYGRGIQAFNGTRLSINDCDFINCQMEVEASGITQLRLLGNTSEGTQGSASTALNSPSVIERGNVWNKPATTKVTNEPWFIAVQSTGQATSGTTPLTMVYQSKNRDGDSSFVAATGTFTCKTPGSYDMRAMLTHAGGTAGDVFSIELVTTSTTYRARYTMPATGDTVSIEANAADMRVGDTAFVRITRLSGTGVFTTSAVGQENIFSGRLVD